VSKVENVEEFWDSSYDMTYDTNLKNGKVCKSRLNAITSINKESQKPYVFETLFVFLLYIKNRGF